MSLPVAGSRTVELAVGRRFLQVDPFAILGLPHRFEIDPDQVRKKVLLEAARRHPDRAPDPITASDWNDELARIHAAAEQLSDDLARAEILIAARGGPAPSEDRTLPDGFLESILAIRMELEEAVASADEAGFRTLESWARDEWNERRHRIGDLLDGPEGDRADVLIAARRELNRWRYAARMLEELRKGLGGRTD